MESSEDLGCYFDDSGKDKPGGALQSFDVNQLAAYESSTSFEESLVINSQTSVECLAEDVDSYLANTGQINVENRNMCTVEAYDAVNDYGNMGKVFIAGSNGSASDSVTELGHKVHKSSMLDGKSQRSENIDFGESVALEDFGGDFDDGPCTLDTVPRATDIFADETGGTSLNAGSVLSISEEDVLGSSTLIKEVAIDHNTASSKLCESKASAVAQDVDTDCNVSKQSSSETSIPSGIRDAEDNSNRDANKELNVNTRPRRSIARKSVFELLQVEYKGSGVSRKHIMEGNKYTSNAEDSSKKSLSNKKKKQCKAADTTEMEMDIADIVTNEGDVLSTKVISYTPDDFSFGANVDSEVQKKAREGMENKSNNAVKLTPSNFKKRKSTGIFAVQEVGRNSFAAEFELASAEVLSQSRVGDEVLKTDSDLIAENRELRARLKALEESGGSVVKKFKIDVHSRKFSRIRSPPASNGYDRKTPGKAEYLAGLEPSKVSESTDAEEAWKSRSALLDRRENKLREISSELDERTSAVRISEGALQRRERKLIELEKTLEYRERVLSRHEQNVQKRELELELNGTAEPGATAAEESSNGEHSTLINEFKKRLDLRRQELDRRQNFLEAEREKLVTRERQVERREQELALKLQGHADSEESNSSEDDNDEDISAKKLSSTKTVNAVTKATPWNKRHVKKTKLAATRVLTLATNKRGKISTSTPHRTLRKGVEARPATVDKSANTAKKLEYKLRKRSV